MNITPLHPEEILSNWGKIRNLIDKALEKEFYDAEDLKDFCMRGILRVYKIGDFNAVCTVELLKHPKKKTALVHTLAGDGMNDWLDDLLNVLKRDAKDNGADALQVKGRRGWIKAAGFKETHTLMECDL